MKNTKKYYFIYYLTLCITVPSSVIADPLTLAVASNFNHATKEIAHQFEQRTDHKVILVFGATGKHYAQIINGAPFDAFFAADRERPALLEKQNRIVPDSRFTYALGQLALWSTDRNPGVETTEDTEDIAAILGGGGFKHLAIANPKLAPYGKAALDVLSGLQLYESLKDKLIYGENIGQTFQFVHSGAAELGFVAYSQVLALNEPERGAFWLLPSSLYQPIEQQAVLLRDTPAGREFFKFVQSDEIRHIIGAYGYRVP